MHLRNGHSTKLANALAATLVMGLLAACSPDDGADASPVATASVDPEPASPSASMHPAMSTGNRMTAAGNEQGVCALLTPEEINAAFNGAIQVVVDAGNDQACGYRIAGHEGELSLERMDANTYQGRKDMYSRGNYGDIEPVAVAGLGMDAYTMGDAQVEVQVGEDEAFRLALILLTRGEPPITPEQGRAALVELAGTVAGRL